MTLRRLLPCLTAVLVAALAVPASADERKFTYSEEAKTLPQGSFEFEQWATHGWTRDQGKFWFLSWREELEYGITDRLSAAVYLNFEVQHADGVPGLKDDTIFEFEGVSLEAKYKLTDPAADAVGLLGYVEVGFGEETEVEAKIVVSKDVGKVVFAYNFIFEYERAENELAISGPDHVTGYLIENTAGASVLIDKSWAVGGEFLARTAFDDNFDKIGTGYFIGPNAHYAAKDWWITLTFIVRVNDQEEFEKYEARVILGINF